MILIGAFLIADTLFVMTRSNINLGVLLPGVLGSPLLLIGLFMPAFKRLCGKWRAVRIPAFILSLAYAAAALVFAFTTVLILVCSKEPTGGADVLIVLGGGIRGNYPTLTLKYRLDKAVDYLEEYPECIAVVSGGQGKDEAVTEASVMQNYLIAHGIDEERILAEDRSRSTEENFKFSKELLDEQNIETSRIDFVTTRFHVFRAEKVALKQGIPAQGIPSKGVWYITFNDYLRESIAITAYLLMGKI